MFSSSSSVGYFHQFQLCQSQLTSTPTNLLSSSSRRLKKCVLPPAMFCRRRMFPMMQLRNFRQISNEEVRQVMTRLPVKVPLSTETVKGVGWKLETIGVTHPLWKISGYATVTWPLIFLVCDRIYLQNCLNWGLQIGTWLHLGKAERVLNNFPQKGRGTGHAALTIFGIRSNWDFKFGT